MKKSIKSLLLMSASAALLAACGNEPAEEQATEETTTEESATSEESSIEEATTVETTDTAGHQVTLPKNPERLAVFDNGQLDILQDLGLADRVAVTASENLPEHLSAFDDLPVAGSLKEVDLEIANAEDPDMAIIAGRSRESFDGLNSFVPTIDVSNNSENVWESIQVNLDYYNDIFDVEDEINTIKEDLENQLTELQGNAESSDLTTLFLMSNEGSLSAFGNSSRFGFVHDLFGFTPVDENIESSRHGMDVSFEYVLEKNPDVIFVLDRTAAIGGDNSSDFTDNALIQETTAYQNDKIITLSPDVWYLTEGGSTAFETMMEEVSQALN